MILEFNLPLTEQLVFAHGDELAAVMARDAITGVTNPWQELFEIDRSVVSRGPWKYLTENVDYPYYLVRDRFAGVSKRSLRSIRRNSGEVVTVDGHSV